MGRPVVCVRVQAEPGVNVIRSLRAWLKVGRRTFGLQCISIEEVKLQENEMVDMRKYTSGPIMADDVRDGPRIERIVSVYISEKHDVPVLELESGDTFMAWPSNARKLARAYGFNSDDWRGHVIQLELGHYTTKDGETRETVDLTPISSRDGSNNGGPQRADPAQLPAPLHKHADKDDMGDEIPFVLAVFIAGAAAWLVAGGSTLIA
jgi:hypothetical protein